MSKAILFVDDEKQPEWFGLKRDEITMARTYDDALKLMKENTYDIIFMDHDLGDVKKDGSMLLIEYFKQGKRPEMVYCISWNSIGMKRILLACGDFGVRGSLEKSPINM